MINSKSTYRIFCGFFICPLTFKNLSCKLLPCEWIRIRTKLSMNIFILNEDPVIAAQEQCDKHVVKMIVESAQMLSTAHRMLDGILTKRPSKSGKRVLKYYELLDSREDLIYKAVHHNHPCTIWTRESVANYKWHYEHFVALCKEYTYRFGKVHSSYTALKDILKHPPINLAKTERTPFALAMGDSPECMFDCPVKSYQAFYQKKQKRFKMDWKSRPTPEWFNWLT